MINRLNNIKNLNNLISLNYLKPSTTTNNRIYINKFTTTISNQNKLNNSRYNNNNNSSISSNNSISFNNNNRIIDFNNSSITINHNNNNKFVNRNYTSTNNNNNNYNNNNYNNINNSNNNNIKQQDDNNKIEKLEQIYTCKVISTCRSYKKGIENLPEGFILQRVFEPSNVRWLVHEESNRDVYIFPSFGCVVSWGITDNQLQSILNWLKPYEIRPIASVLSDTYRYKISNQKSINFEITKRPHELLNLSKTEKDQEIEKFCSSYAFAQSVALFPLEDRVQNISDIVEDISITGKINQLPKIKILKQLGEQLLIKSSINLHSDFETPEFFWEHTEGENIYNMVRSHCEIGKRIRIMNEKLNLITDIYDVINDEQKHKHSIRLERIIIFLIGMEIFITLLRELRDYYVEKRKEEELEEQKRLNN